MNIFVTGSSGQLGSHLCSALQESGHMTYGIDLEDGHHTDIIGDVRYSPNIERLRGMSSSFNAVVNCAGITQVEMFDQVDTGGFDAYPNFYDVIEVNLIAPIEEIFTTQSGN